jgi:predicted metalloprotease with PDZ domain
MADTFRLSAGIAAALIVGVAVGYDVAERQASAERADPPSVARSDAMGLTKLGLTGEPLTAPTARRLNLPTSTEGLVVTSLASHGPAARAGLRVGDIVKAVNGRPLTGTHGLREVADSNGPAELTILRGDVTSTMEVG